MINGWIHQLRVRTDMDISNTGTVTNNSIHSQTDEWKRENLQYAVDCIETYETLTAEQQILSA